MRWRARGTEFPVTAMEGPATGDPERNTSLATPRRTIRRPRASRRLAPQRVVRDIMSRKVVTVSVDDGLGLARQYMRLAAIRHLVVLREGNLAGIISERDILNAAANHGVRATWAMRACDVMRQPVLTVVADDRIETAAQKMATHKIGCLPVLDGGGAVVGILTTTDLLRDRALGF